MKSDSQRQKAREQLLRDAGLVQTKVWHKPEDKSAVMSYDRRNEVRISKEITLQS